MEEEKIPKLIKPPKTQSRKYIEKKHRDLNAILSQDIDSSNGALTGQIKTLSQEIAKQQQHIRKIRYWFLALFCFITIMVISLTFTHSGNKTINPVFAETLGIAVLTSLYQMLVSPAREALNQLKMDRRAIVEHFQYTNRTQSNVLAKEQADLTKYIVRDKPSKEGGKDV